MDINLSLANLNIIVHSNLGIIINNKIKSFIKKDKVDSCVEIDFEFIQCNVIEFQETYFFQKYYKIGNDLFYLTENKKQQIKSICKYDYECKKFSCKIIYSNKDFNPDIESLLHMVPFNYIFQFYGVAILHASQISLNKNDGVLFVASSGVGKTTQSKLWEEYEKAEIVCNDRTLIRRINNKWMTFGYFVDGSEPVYSNKMNELKAIVCLSQRNANIIERLSVIKSIPLLELQMMPNKGNELLNEADIELLLNIINDVPVYYLSCTPDKRAVEILKKKLIEDEVIHLELRERLWINASKRKIP